MAEPITKIRLTAGDGAVAEVSAHGGQVVGWVPTGAGGKERLFLSPLAAGGPGASIRGGVPVIFPQFGPMGPLPKHGLARNREWQVAEAAGGRARLVLESSAETRGIWPHDFLAELVVEVSGAALAVELRITNTGREVFSFTAALHTYLRVAEATVARVAGLQGARYLDEVTMTEHTDDAEEVSFGTEVDRIYYAVGESPLRLVEGGRVVEITEAGFDDVVVWNPGPVVGGKFADLEPEGWREFVCVEAAAVGRPVVLGPGEVWAGRQRLAAG